MGERIFNEYKQDAAQINPNINPGLWKKWENFKHNQLDLFIKKVTSDLKNIKPELHFSIPIYPDYKSSKSYMTQDWLSWSEKEYFDFFHTIFLFKASF